MGSAINTVITNDAMIVGGTFANSEYKTFKHYISYNPKVLNGYS